MPANTQPALNWFASLGWTPQKFQQQAWQVYLQGKSGLVNAPTGSGKTYSLLIPALLEGLANKKPQSSKGLQIIWLTPIRALAKEIELSARRAIVGLGSDWEVGIRTGDTPTKERAKQSKQMPQLLITTPESLHLMMCQKGYASVFKNLKCVVADEWHELVGSKRGVQVELALSRLKNICNQLKIWGISATIGNLEQAREILLGTDYYPQSVIIKSDLKKEIVVETVFPDEIENFPWAGHMGIRLLEKVMPIIESSKSTLIFTNTRAQSEIWYQRLLEAAPHLSGILAMHHGSISQELRHWVEENLHTGALKAVVCTSSLDLGVDFRPVETIIQIGSPKGVARFLQRAGRSGHQPGKPSKIFFVPTHSLEIIEGAALREAIAQGIVEDRTPFIRSFDVLIQYLVTLAVSDGFRADEVYEELITTFCYNSLSPQEFEWILRFIVSGGESLQAYDEYHKVVLENGLFKVESRAIAMRHRLSIGTIVSDTLMRVKFLSGKNISTVEESFISRLRPGDVFWIAGRNLELVQVKQMDALVRKADGKKGITPSWGGGRMPLSSQLSEMLRHKLHTAHTSNEPEMKLLRPLFDVQAQLSVVPNENQFLIEKFTTDEGCLVYFYPFEGRFVHEGMAALLAYRLGHFKNFSFSIAMNDYGFELLSDQDIPIEQAIDSDIFTLDHLAADIRASINDTEMARRKFSHVCRVAGLVFQGFPGRGVKERHLQSSSHLFFDVFHEHEPDNLLLKQAYEEVYDFQLEQTRMRAAMERINRQEIVIRYPERPTPFCFPIMVDRLREKFSNEPIEDRIKKMKLAF
jgi:ATP-dependent helicase Lhr and Lhr-like helicase